MLKAYTASEALADCKWEIEDLLMQDRTRMTLVHVPTKNYSSLRVCNSEFAMPHVRQLCVDQLVHMLMDCLLSANIVELAGQELPHVNQ